MNAAQQPAVSNADKANLRDAMAQLSVLPLWEIYEKVVTHEPSMAVPSHIWKWRDMSGAIEIASRAVTGHDADHRVFVLKNPAVTTRVTTSNNILGAVQCVLPGEKTTPHRHTPAACRIVLESRGAQTFVDGVACPMYDGDFVVTPNWTWHCHGNPTDARAVWVDLLDVPFVLTMNAMFGEIGLTGTYPDTLATALPAEVFTSGGLMPVTDFAPVPYTPRLRYAWGDVLRMLAATEPAGDGSRTIRYTNPLDGGPVIPTMDATALEIRGEKTTQPVRNSASGICVVVEGAGETRVGDKIHQWEARDIFTIPEWNWVSHTASTPTARLMFLSDREIRRKLGLFREERG